MVDTPTTRNLLRKQSLGSNLNTWGDAYLNDVLDAVDKGLSGVQSIALTGDRTLTASNYSTSNEVTNQTIKFTGALSSPVTVTVPSIENAWTIMNAAGADVTVKTASGSGVTIPSGRQLRVSCDGADVFNESPNNLPGFTPTLAKDVVPKDYADAREVAANSYTDLAVAAAAIPGADGTVRMDATAGAQYLNDAILVSSGLTKTDNGNSMTLSATADRFVEVTTGGTEDAAEASRLDANTSGGGFTRLLPAAPSDNETFWYEDSGGTWETNNFVISGNGKTISLHGAVAQATLTCDVNNAAVVLRFDSGDDQWKAKAFK